RRDIGDRAFEHLQERLLNALARYVAGNRRILVLSPDLVDLINVDDARLRAFDVSAGVLDEAKDNVLDVLADVACFGKGRRIDDRERYAEQPGQRLCEKGLPGSGRTDQKDVGLLKLDVGFLLRQLDPLVV